MTSDQAREVARARWGTTRTDRIVAELRDRADELEPPQIAALQDLLAGVGGHREGVKDHE